MLREDSTESTQRLFTFCLNAVFLIFFFFSSAECLCSWVYWQMTRTEDGQWQWAQCRPTAHTHCTVCSRAVFCQHAADCGEAESVFRWFAVAVANALVEWSDWTLDTVCTVECVVWALVDSPLIFCSSCCRAETERGLNRKHIIEGKQVFFFLSPPVASSFTWPRHACSCCFPLISLSYLPLMVSPPPLLCDCAPNRMQKLLLRKSQICPPQMFCLLLLRSSSVLWDVMKPCLNTWQHRFVKSAPSAPLRCLASWPPGPQRSAQPEWLSYPWLCHVRTLLAFTEKPR